MGNAFLVFASFFVSALGGIVPLVNVELWLLGVASASPSAIVPVVLAASLGQMAAKAFLYRAGCAGLPTLRRRGPSIESVMRRLADHEPRAAALVFASALGGLPPFYLVSMAAGVTGFPFRRFLALGLAGRLLRFTLVFLLPRLALPATDRLL